MSLADLAAAWPVFAVFTISAFIKGVTGLGFSTVCVALFATIGGLKESLALVILPSVCSNAFVMYQAGFFGEMLGRFRFLYLALLPGLGLGLWFLGGAENAFIEPILGLVLTGYCLFVFLDPNARLPQKLEGPLAAPVGLITGLVNGLTGSQVMPVMPYLMGLNLNKDRFVQAINISFTLSSLIMALGLAQMELMTWRTLAISACGLPLVYGGVVLGSRIRRRISENAFRRLAVGLLFILGLNLVVQALWT